MPSLKDISVPANPGARRGKKTAAGAPAAMPVAAPPAAKRPLPRAIAAPPAHRYRIGERLRVGYGGYSVARAAAFCKVVALLPYEGHGSMLYRVRSDTEAFERVVAEADLSRSAETT